MRCAYQADDKYELHVSACGQEDFLCTKIGTQGDKLALLAILISFHFISFHFVSFRFVSFHFISFHFISLFYFAMPLVCRSSQARDQTFTTVVTMPDP